jgi:hypothetical protein
LTKAIISYEIQEEGKMKLRGGRIGTWIGWILVGVILSGCSGERLETMPAVVEQPTTQAPSNTTSPATATTIITVTPRVPTATITPTVPWWLEPRSRKMEDHGVVYNPNAEPIMPPVGSVSMAMWWYEVPLQTIDGEPQMVGTTPPAALTDPLRLLEELGCSVKNYGKAFCPEDSLLLTFGCEEIYRPNGLYPELGEDTELVATCFMTPPNEELPTENDLFQLGCAFRVNASHIFRVEDEYVRISSPKELKDFFGVIENPAEALNYAELRTGLVAQFEHEYVPDLLYFADTITGTQVTATEDGYLMNLFHYAYCSCEPYINSEVEILVSKDGEVSWLSALPISMTIGFGCTD